MNLRVKQPVIELEDFDRSLDLPQGEKGAFDISSMWRILRARQTVLIGTVAAVLSLTLVAMAFITQTYSAQAVMMLDQRKNAVADVNAVLSGLPADTASVQNQIQVLTSRQLALNVVRKLKLDQDPEFNTEL